jgi:hypothetical protein
LIFFNLGCSGDEWETIDDTRPDIVHNVFAQDDEVEGHTEVDYGADDGIVVVDEFPA